MKTKKRSAAQKARISKNVMRKIRNKNKMKVQAETESKTEERTIAYKIRELNRKKLKRENKEFKKGS